MNANPKPLKRGTFFVHAFWMDESHRPLLCEVTAIRHGSVYWRDANSFGRATDCFRVEHATRYVKEIK